MKLQFARDPLIAMEELKSLHRALRGPATREEFEQYCKDHPDYTGGIPFFVEDYLFNLRKDLVRPGYGLQFFLKTFKLPSIYVEALLSYVKRFPLDTPRPGEIPSSEEGEKTSLS